MNGDEFIKKLREFDQETITYLHTAYSEELPATEMMEKYNIQGYIDKGKGDEERIQQLTSALKHNELLELVKKQTKEIESLNYKNEFMGKFLGMLMGEIKERSFGINLKVKELEEIEINAEAEKQRTFEKSVKYISESIHKINDLIEALEIDNRTISVEELNTILQKLFQVKLCITDSKLNIRVEGNDTLIDCDAKVLIYMLVDIIEYLLDNKQKDINIYSEIQEDSRIFKICNEIKSEEIIKKLRNLSMFDEKISVEKEFEQIIIKIK